MATLQMDLPSANRFVSSLSKSLQALCHGCMDFDTEIEIVGYINVNIDCGSKVDYVLNEKVSKSTNNSMKFISNSFLAKKDQPKTERSCSPIPELNVRPTPRGSASSSYSSSQLYKSSGIFSPHSQVLRGSQKRSWSGGDWRFSHRKMAKGPRSQYESSYNAQSQPQQSEYSSQQSSSFSKPSTSQPDYNYSESTQSHVQVKSEAADESGSSYDQNIPSGDNSTNPESNALVSDIRIKSDPDSAETSNTSNTTSFLHPQTTDGNSEQNSDQTAIESDSFFKTEHDDSSAAAAAGEGQDGGDYNNEEPNDGDASQAYSETDVSFQTAEGQEYTGEESGDGSQFDIIEIDDEDEDLAAFTDEDNFDILGQPSNISDSYRQSAMKGSGSHSSIGSNIQKYKSKCRLDPITQKYCCPFCRNQYVSIQGAIQHIKVKHEGLYPFSCKICGKGFERKIHLLGHMTTHGQPAQFECSVCGQKYAYKTSLKHHQRMSHLILDS